MSSFYDDASLVMIPSCYKISTVLCEKPTDGSGDLTFTRTGDTATRVNSSGLVEKVRTNLTLYSEQFDNASWTKGTLTVTINAGAAPNGTTTADLIYPSANSSNSVIFNGITIANSTEYTNSIYVKASGKTWTYIRGINDGAGVWFDVANGVVGAMNIGVSGTITSVGSGWYRCSVTQTSSSTTGRLVVLVVDGNGSTAVTASGTNGLLIWGAQQETGVATAYIPTTTAAVSVGPVANLARLDYLNSSCPRLLLEPQRTNLYTYSEQLNQWTASSATVTANYAVSPDGYTNADRVQFAAGGLLYVSGTGSAGENTLSVYAKATNGTSAKFRFFGNGNTTFSSDQTATGEWQRFTFTYTFSASTAGLKVATTGADDVIFYGFQHEIGAYATSYIPTLASASTRSADITTKTGISSLIGQTNGTAQMTFVMDFDTSGDSTTMLGIHAGTSTANRIQLTSRFGTVRLLVIANNSIVTNDLLYDAAPNEVVNVAFKYGSAGVTAYVNGTQRYTTASAVVFTETMTLFTIGNRSGIDDYGKGQRVSQSLLFNSALANAQLAELTTI